MVMSYFWMVAMCLGAWFGLSAGRGAALTAAVNQGAAEAIALSVSMAGPICLWSGLGRLMEGVGWTDGLARLFGPVLDRLFPSSRADPALKNALCGNFCANLLGLGNAATPMGIQAVRRLQDPRHPREAADELCRLVVLNTASVQLLPTTVAAVRQSLGCPTPFDILPCVWVSSLLSVSAGLLAAWGLSRVWRHG